MSVEEAVQLIRRGIPDASGNWADIGAGTGMFTTALRALLGRSNRSNLRTRSSRIYAVDKSPHALWELKSTSNVEIIVVEADFSEPLELPPMDGIVMANALHYAEDHLIVLKNVLHCLKPGGTFILVEYETETPRPPWVPHPVPVKRFETLCPQAHLNKPEIIGKHESQYGYEHIYAAMTTKI